MIPSSGFVRDVHDCVGTGGSPRDAETQEALDVRFAGVVVQLSEGEVAVPPTRARVVVDPSVHGIGDGFREP